MCSGKAALHSWPRRGTRGSAGLAEPRGPGADLTAHDVVMLGRLPTAPGLPPPSPADHAAVEAAMQAQSRPGAPAA